MNCELCHLNLEAYRTGSLHREMRDQVEEHLKYCKDCAEIMSLVNLAEKVIHEEIEQESNPFLSTRIMAAIEAIETDVEQTSPLFLRIIKQVLIITSLAAAIIIGILVGDLSNSANTKSTVPLEMALINDANMEAINLLSNE